MPVAPPAPAHDTRVTLRFERDEEIARVALGDAPGSPLDLATVVAVHEAVSGLRRHHRLKLLVFEGPGPDFSTGAPPRELLPEGGGRFLPAFHHLVTELEDIGVPTAALVRGRCFGAGLELAACCGRVFCDATARFAATGTALGTVPVLAAVVLPWRVGGTHATDLVLSGRTLTPAEAITIGLADRQAQDLEAALKAYFDEQLAPKSALVLRYAWRMARAPLAATLEKELPRLTQLVVDDLMTHRDAIEGVRALMENRQPTWTHV